MFCTRISILPLLQQCSNQLLMPTYLAYGERTMGMIKPNLNLIFGIELLEVPTRDDLKGLGYFQHDSCSLHDAITRRRP